MPILRRFLREDAGGAMPLFALALFMLLGFGAMAIDVGSLFHERRRQQTATDLAALAAVSDLPRAQAAARASVVANGYDAETLGAIEFGQYRPDRTTPVAERFRPGPVATANAVRIRQLSLAPLFLGRVLRAGSDPALMAPADGSHAPIGTSAIAALDPQASFAVGSRLLRIEGGVLNAVLGGLLGTNLSLSAMDYEALAQARLDMFSFSRRHGERFNLTAGSYNDAVRLSTTQRNALFAALEAAREHETATARATDALQRIAMATGSDLHLDLRQLVSLGSLGDRPASGPRPVPASLSILDFLMATGQISNGTRQLDLALALNLPGIASARLRLAIGERPVGTAMLAVSRVGASVHTAQTRLLLTLDLIGSGPAPLVRLPLYVEIATATARLLAIECRGSDPIGSRVVLGVTPGVVDAWIGDVTAARFADLSRPPNPPAASLLATPGLARVTGRAHVAIANLAETRLNFDYPEILRGEKKTTSTTNFAASLLARLFGDLDLRVEAVGFGLPVPGLAAAVGGVVSGAASPVDQLLTSVLGALGVGLGQADSRVSGVRCGGAVLVR